MEFMGKSKLNRRQFLKLSAGAAAAAMFSPYMARLRAQDTQLRVSMWDSEVVKPTEDEVLQGFTDEHGAEVSIEFNPDQYDTKLLSGLAAGNAPDVFLWWNYPPMVERGGLENIMPYVEGASPLDLSIYYQPVLNVGRIGDALYGIPKDWTSRAIFYNKALFDTAGIPYPDNDWTWEEFLAIAQELTQGEGVDKQYGFYTWNSQYPIQGFVWSNGGDFISPDGMQATGYLDSPETIEALDWYIRLQTEHLVAPSGADAETVGDASTLFINGKLAMLENGIWPLSQFLQVDGLEIGTVLPPKTNDGNRVTVLHQADWAMNPDGANKEQAWELLKWLTSPRAAAIRGASGFSLPAIPAVAEELGLLDDPIRKTFYEAVDDMTVLPWFIRTNKGGEVEAEINLAIQSAFLGEMSIEDALVATAPIVDDILQS
jgi:multiple sugar transport system substrate-binding protein